MSKIGRNSPCPCGSGKKYKRCCLAHDETCRSLPQEQTDAKALAVGWLKEHHGEAVKRALTESFPSDRAWKDIAKLPDSVQTAVDSCLDEWLIADAVLFVNDERTQAGDLLLGPDGPLFNAQGRQYIEEVAASELSLYEVLEVRGNEEIVLRDMLRQDAPPVFIQQNKETETLVIWDTLGARILRRHDKCTLGSGLCPMARAHATGLASALRKAMQREARKKRPKATAAEITSTGIIAAWISAITTPPDVPALVHAQTREPLVLIRDTYLVSDWTKLENLLTARGDVQKDGTDAWTWFEDIGDKEHRPCARLKRRPSGLLETECRAQGKADTARAWLEDTAGAFLSHTDRETVDIHENLMNRTPSPPDDPARKKRKERLPPEIRQSILSRHMARNYEEWIVTPLPTLNGKTPLQAARLKTCRSKVVELLKCIERGEAHTSRKLGLPAFDVSFLWERLGLARPCASQASP